MLILLPEKGKKILPAEAMALRLPLVLVSAALLAGPAPPPLRSILYYTILLSTMIYYTIIYYIMI